MKEAGTSGRKDDGGDNVDGDGYSRYSSAKYIDMTHGMGKTMEHPC